MTTRRRRTAIGVLVGTVVLASCTTVSGIVRTQRALSSAGFREPTVDFSADSDRTVLHVGYRTDAKDVAALADEYVAASRVVWTKAPLSFDSVTVDASGGPDCVGDCIDEFDRAALLALHGARDPALEKDIESELIGTGLVALGVIAFAVVVLLTLLIRSRRRAKRRQTWGPPGAYGGGYPAPYVGPYPGQYPGPQPPGWQQPPPPAPTPHQPAPGYAPPPPGYVPPPPAPAAGRQWPPASPPPEYEPPPGPPPMPTHDIWERPPS